MPVSVTANCRRRSASGRSIVRTVSRTVPRSVNLIALSSRLTRICRSRKRSVAMAGGIAPTNSTSSRRSLASALPRSDSTTSETIASGEQGSRSTRSSPASIREMSSRSSISASRNRPFWRMVAKCSGISAGPALQVGMFIEQFDETQDGGQRGPDLMAHAGQELALGPAGPFGRLLGPAHGLGLLRGLGDPLLLGDIADDLQDSLARRPPGSW